MPVTINGTTGITGPDGSASTPAVQGTDSNTGLFFPAADTVAISTGGTQRLRLDSSGNLGLGVTPSANIRLYVRTAATTDTAYYADNGANSGFIVKFAAALTSIGNDFNQPLALLTNNTERARITGAGYFKASNAGTYQDSTGAYHELRTNGSDWTALVSSANATAGNCFGVRILYSAASPNGTGNQFLTCVDWNGSAVTTRAELRSNGGLANYSANNVNLSDRREKTNFAPAKSYLNTICAIPVQTFNYIDQSEDDPGLTLGVVAQDVQAVAPELVMESNWGTEENPKMRLSIYQTDLQYALMKCIQELKADLDATKAELAALKGA